MTLPDSDSTNNLIIQESSNFQIENFQIEVLSYLGQFATDIYYFKVNILPINVSTTSSKLGLLRIGSIEGGLSRELQLREILADYKLIAELLAHTTVDSVDINLHSSSVQLQNNQQPQTEVTEENDEDKNALNEPISDEPIAAVEKNSDYLEEEYYPEKEIISDSSTRKLILLSYLPDETKTLENWLKTDHYLEESLLLTSQVCQLLRYVHQRNWCFVCIIPQLIQMTTPIQFFDLTSAYSIGEVLSSGLLGNYCAPELAYGKNPIQESMSSYTVGALLYHAIHQQNLLQEQAIDLKIRAIPGIYQLLKISLSPIPEERFPLPQILGILLEIRQAIRTPQIQWHIASHSTVGLSIKRLQNEDNYGVRQQQLSYSETLLLGVVADGMGGLSQGELASKLAVQTVLEEPIPSNFKTIEHRNEWLISLFQKANDTVANNIRDGGTTLSLVLAIAQQLMIAHVGDSRIYLLRQGEIRQLSEDHSLVATLVASGQITEAESLDHPDRNALTKSIGSKRRLSDGYVQDLRRTTQELSLNLKHGDILLLCSDGVWDLIPKHELAEIFNNYQDLQLAVDKTLEQVLERGASDNATLLALKCQIENITKSLI